MVQITSTKSADQGRHNILLMAHHGWGKTTQCKHLQEEYGPGLIISGESGLRSLQDVDIDVVEFKSWQEFLDIVKLTSKENFVGDLGYTWIAVDSLTELSERCFEYVEKIHEGSSNGFAIWGDYSKYMLGALKWLRDLPCHCYMTVLVAEETDDNGRANYWPLMKGTKVAKHLPGLYDHVFCGVRMTEGDASNPTIKRFVITEEVRGWHGKNRGAANALKPVEETDNIVDLLKKLDNTN